MLFKIDPQIRGFVVLTLGLQRQQTQNRLGVEGQ
jgi:hypothetical protein